MQQNVRLRTARSHLTILPERGGGLVVLSNYSETPIRELREALVERAFAESGASSGRDRRRR